MVSFTGSSAIGAAIYANGAATMTRVLMELGGKGDATNPEQLFAAGYAACFENAVIHVTRAQTDKVGDDDIEVSCQVGLLPNGNDGFNLAVTLDVEIAGVNQAKADEIVKNAHAACPYSNAVSGNVDVKINVFVQ
jgi:Ohr subfamily peroxiredoxin